MLGALARAGVRSRLEAVVLTHDDADHSGGLAAVASRLEVGAVYAPAGAGGGRPLVAGDRLDVGRARVEVLASPAVAAGGAAGDDASGSGNDRSLVLMVRVGERSVLLPADIEAAGEAQLLAAALELRADVMVVPHHGSRSSSSAAFVHAVAPAVAVVSVGAGNAYGHPDGATLARYGDAAVLRTDLHGDVRVRTDGQRLWVQPLRAASGTSADACATLARTTTPVGTPVATPGAR